MLKRRRRASGDGDQLTSRMESASLFIRACQTARMDLHAPFPPDSLLERGDERLAWERVKLNEAKAHIEQVQEVLYLLQTNKEYTPVEWAARNEENHSVVCMRRSWMRHGFYEEALRNIDECMCRLGMALRNTEVDLCKQSALTSVSAERAHLQMSSLFNAADLQRVQVGLGQGTARAGEGEQEGPRRSHRLQEAVQGAPSEVLLLGTLHGLTIRGETAP
jgi:hypothetical protein